jgi:hypothetical protein
MDVQLGNGSEEPVGDSSVESNGDSEEEFSLANPFLNGMPEEHRTLLAPYVKKWDGQVTKKFQDYSSKLKPYEQLGPVEELTKYQRFANNFRQDPEGLFRTMWMGLQEQYGENFETELLRILEMQEDAEMSDEYEYEDGEEEQYDDSPDIFQQNVIKELEDLRAWRDSFEAQQEDAEGQAQLDGVLEEMHNQLGDFDDDFIIAQLAKHGDVQQAVTAWNNLVGKYSSQNSQPTRQAPKIMGGQGGVPTGQVETEKLRGSDRRQAVANMLAQLEG